MPDTPQSTARRNQLGLYVPCGSRSDAPWFCVYTKPGSETLAHGELRNQGFPSYVPLHLTGREPAIKPLFPRYIFAQPRQDGQWGSILHTRGVSSVLMTAQLTPKHVPISALQSLWAQCHPNGCIYPEELPSEIAPGSNLRIIAGPLVDLTGICQKSDAERVWLLGAIMNRPVTLMVKRTAVEMV